MRTLFGSLIAIASFLGSVAPSFAVGEYPVEEDWTLQAQRSDYPTPASLSAWNERSVKRAVFTIRFMLGVDVPSDLPKPRKFSDITPEEYEAHCNACQGMNEFIPELNELWMPDDATVEVMGATAAQFVQYHGYGMDVDDLNNSWAIGEQRFLAEEFIKAQRRLNGGGL